MSVVSFICVSGKKIKERYNDRILQQNINVQIQNPSTQYQYNNAGISLNNAKNNIPLLNGYEMTLVISKSIFISKFYDRGRP